MDTTLITVTVLSMSMAAALSAIVWRMLRLERQRSNARVAALSAAARRADTPAREEPDLPLAPRDFSERSVVHERISESPLFVAREHASPWGTRVAVMAAVALVVASVVLFSLAARAPKGTRSGPARANVSAAAPANAGLELMSLRDSRQPGSLTISGVVQNPRTGTHLSRVAVTAYTFDDKGSFLASGRALLDVTALEPGDESPFTVTVPVTDDVARYRIGFRDEAGRVIEHVDRREQGSPTRDPVTDN